MELYVPRLPAHNQVRVFPGAQSIEDFNINYAGSYVLTSAQPTKFGTTLGTTTISGQEFAGQDYWVISGITGTGAQGETASEPTPTPTPTPTPSPTPTPIPTATPPPAPALSGYRSLPDPATWALILSGVAFLFFYTVLSRRRRPL